MNSLRKIKNQNIILIKLSIEMYKILTQSNLINLVEFLIV